MSELTTLLLTGGASQRMGQDKALLDFAGQPLWAKIAHQAAPLSLELWVIQHPTQSLGSKRDRLPNNLRSFVDLQPHLGPLAGLAQVAPQLKTPWAFVLSTDLPFLTRSFLLEMIGLRKPNQAVVTCNEGIPNPLLALYPTPWVQEASRFWAKGETRASFLLSQGPSVLLKDRPESRGINHPNEYLAAKNSLS